MQSAAFSPSALAMESYYRLKPEDQTNKPTSYKKAGNVKALQWYRAEDKERGNVLCFNTWDRIPQKGITKESFLTYSQQSCETYKEDCEVSQDRLSIQKNLQKLGITLNDEEIKKVTQRIIELGDKKEIVTTEDLPYIISDVLNSDLEQKVKVNSYVLTHAKGLQPNTVVSLDIKGKIFEESAAGDGQFDAFMNALKKLYQKKKMSLPELTDYAVRIPPGSNSDALCETLITWKNRDKEFITRGLDSDQTVSAIKATEKMLNIIAT